MTRSPSAPFLDFDQEGKKTTGKILLVEDVESIQLAIRDFLFSRYEVQSVTTAEHALMTLAMAPDIDLLITDIKLPEMNGFELGRLARKLRPNIPIIIITSYDVNEFIDIIKEHGFSQIITKHGRMSLKEIEITIEKMLSGDIFGVKKYFPELRETEITLATFPRTFANGVLYTTKIKSLHERGELTDRIAAHFKSQKRAPESTIKLVLDEITSNAMFRAPVTDGGEFKYQTKNSHHDILHTHQNIVLDEEDRFTLQFGILDDWIIMVCIDPHGRLTKKEILYRLHRHLTIDANTGLPAGLHDSHGRGIFLLREQLSSLVFNISRERKTEVICLYNSTSAQAYKNISVYEIDNA
ncbi:MAG: response regulator [Spirochaetes bacterium]|nr:response regulator [Spirochaetota bacterium]MBX3720518.1 response regulator [Turneriella sp.]